MTPANAPLSDPYEADRREPGHHEGAQQPGDPGFVLPKPAQVSPARATGMAATALVILASAFVAGYLPRQREKKELEATAAGNTVSTPKVEVVKPSEASSDRVLALPGSVQALEETTIYSRASGYVRKWYVDLGDKVTEGQLLAELDTPEIDQELVQARAQLAQADAALVQAKANASFSKQNSDRYGKLAPDGIASQMDVDKAKAQAEVDVASITVANANVEGQHANIQRLAQLKSFARVVAPFAGTITGRSVERGALVTAGNASPLFKISATDPVRVFVQVPQDVAPTVRVGANAIVKVREFAGRSFDGKIARTAGALDSATRTMTTEVRVPNPNGELLTGMYAQVSLSLPTPHRVFGVPGTALLNDAKGLRVAVVGADDRIHLVPVTVERDTGSVIEISAGLDGTERVVKLPGPDLADGRVVEVAH
jgi:RND family efflux transporter MFP subunit